MVQPVSVLVDGDNISGKHAEKILSVAAQHGEPTLVRVYADAQRPSGWHGAIGYRMLQAGTGKNATDILLGLDALELLLSKGKNKEIAYLYTFKISLQLQSRNKRLVMLNKFSQRLLKYSSLFPPNAFNAALISRIVSFS